MKLYRLIESIIKKIYRIPNYTKNEKLKKTFISAEYNTSTHQDLIFSSKDKINYILKNNEEISKIVFINGEFDFYVLKKGLKLLKKKKLKYLVSIGSHVGTTLIPAIKFGLFDNCIAFEPSIENYRLLTANIHINKIEKKISLFNIGLSKKACNGYLKNNPLNSGDYRVIKSKKNSKKIRLDILDNFTSKMDKKNSFYLWMPKGMNPIFF